MAFGRNTMHFHIFILFRFLCNKRCSKFIFRVLDEKPTHKHVLRRQMTEIGNFDLVTSDDLDLRKGHLGLRTMLRYVTDPNHVDSSAAYAFIPGILLRKGIKWKCQTFCVWPDLWRHRWPRGQIFKPLSERSRPGLSIAVWIFPLRLLVSRDRWGADTPPPPAEGRVRTRPSRARVKVTSSLSTWGFELR